MTCGSSSSTAILCKPFSTSQVQCYWPLPAHCLLISSAFPSSDVMFIHSKKGCMLVNGSSLRPEEILVFLSTGHVRTLPSSGMLPYVALVKTNVSKEHSASIIRVKRIFQTCISCQLLLTLFLAHGFLSPWWRKHYVPPKRRFLQEPHGVTSQRTAFFIVTAVNTSNLTGAIFVAS
jgi:hypothetical protein